MSYPKGGSSAIGGNQVYSWQEHGFCPYVFGESMEIDYNYITPGLPLRSGIRLTYYPHHLPAVCHERSVCPLLVRYD